MNDLAEQRRRALADCLGQYADTIESAGPDAWRLALPGTTPLRTIVRAEGDWLLWHAPFEANLLGVLTAKCIAGLLRGNGNLPSGAKFCLDEHPGRLSLSAETPLCDSIANLAQRVAATAAGFRLARDGFQNLLLGEADPFGPRAAPASGEPTPDRSLPCDPAALCREAGWPGTERESGQVAVPLEVRGAFHQALIAPSEDGGLHLEVDLGNAQTQTVGAAAAEVFLLGACRVVRLARAAAALAEGVAAYRWEATLGPPPSGAELDAALAALSVACQISAREIEALLDEKMAREFLKSRGWSSLLLDSVGS